MTEKRFVMVPCEVFTLMVYICLLLTGIFMLI